MTAKPKHLKQTGDRLWIPLLRICVPVYWRKIGTNGQEIVDADDSAAIWKWNGLTVIADHNGQNNFANLNNAKPEKTKAILTVNGTSRLYVCDVSEVGSIVTYPYGSRLYTAENRPVHEAFPTGLCIYTCRDKTAENVRNVRLTHWR